MSMVYSACPIYQIDRLNHSRLQTDRSNARVGLIRLLTTLITSQSINYLGTSRSLGCFRKYPTIYQSTGRFMKQRSYSMKRKTLRINGNIAVAKTKKTARLWKAQAYSCRYLVQYLRHQPGDCRSRTLLA